MIKSLVVILGKLGICVGICVGISTAASAQSSMSTTKAKINYGSLTGNEDPVGWVPFAAVGVSAVEFDQTLTTQDGFSTNGRAIGSYYTQSRNYVYDLGVGADFADLNGREVNTALIETAARMRFGSTNKWQVGPVANFNVGPDAGIDYGSTVNSIATFAGLQLARDFAAGEQSIVRAGLKAMTDVGIPNSVVNKFLFELQWGQVAATKVTESHTVEVKKEEPKIELEEIEAEPVEEVVAVEMVEEPKFYRNPVVVREVVAPQSLYFYEGKNEIGPRNREMVKRYTQFFNRHRNSIKRVQLVGFVDNANESGFGTGLSFERAKKIENELKMFGLDGDIVIEAMGAGPLTANEVGRDLRRARRVDINVLGTEATNWDEELKRLRSYR